MSTNIGLNESIETELEVIKAIYVDDLTVDVNQSNDILDARLATICVEVSPKTGHNTDDQLVRLTLVIVINKNYPNEWPVIDLKNIRGLTDDKIEIIKSSILKICEEKRSEPMLYDIIEKSRDVLTTLNNPIGNRCAICLYDFTTNDQTMRSECFHHFHCRCFANYVSKQMTLNNNEFNASAEPLSLSLARISCPVCRVVLNTSELGGYVDPNQYSIPELSNESLEDESAIIEEAKRNVNKFSLMYEKQLKNDGIIDIEKERNKYFIRLTDIDINQSNQHPTETAENVS